MALSIWNSLPAEVLRHISKLTNYYYYYYYYYQLLQPSAVLPQVNQGKTWK